MADNEPIGLKELITRVKAELLEDFETEQPLFAVGQVNLELSFTVARTANGGINFHVVQVGADTKSTDVQSVKVTLEPLVPLEELRQKITPEQKQTAQKKLTRGFHPDS
ncbi:MAG: hypothetical protein NVSMB52_17080 [Chloroflexota bacterium]